MNIVTELCPTCDGYVLTPGVDQSDDIDACCCPLPEWPEGDFRRCPVPGYYGHQHCVSWWDGRDACCACGSPAPPSPEETA